MKGLIARYRSDAISLQKLSEINGTVIKIGEIDEPLAHEPPRLVGADWNAGTLHLTLDRPVNDNWISALRNMGNFSSLLGVEPNRFRFDGSEAFVIGISEQQVETVITNFKVWLGKATQTLKQTLIRLVQEEARERATQLQLAREAEELRQRVNARIKI